MKRLACSLILLTITFYAFDVCLSKEEKVIIPKNEYKGKTIEDIYGPNEKEYKEGVSRTMTYYDNFRRIKRIEFYHTEERLQQDNIYKREHSYKYSTLRGAIIRSSTFLYSDAYSRDHGLTRIDVQYDYKGRKQKEEFWYTDAFAARRNYAKVEVLYERGNPKRRVFYGSDGAIVSSEEKKEVWKSE